MSTARRYRIVSFALASVLGGLVALTACSNYEEGDRCESLSGNSGNDDCQSPLQCVPYSQINSPFNNSDRCCPVDRSTATHPACTQQTAVGADASPPPDTGPTPDAKPDSPAEAAAPEASTDANDDGG